VGNMNRDYLIIYKFRVKNWWAKNELKVQQVIETTLLALIGIEILAIIIYGFAVGG
jgi:hypothetical protein